MNPEVILGLISDLYSQLATSQLRVQQLEEDVAGLREQIEARAEMETT